MEVQGINVTTCFYVPPNINSNGMYITDAKIGNWLNSSMPRFEVMAIFIVLVSQACHFVLQHFGLPMFFSQLIAGRILATIIKNEDPPLMNAEDSIKVLGTIATLGYSACVFLIGVKVDLGMIRRAGKKAFFIGIFSVVVPLLCGFIATRLLFKNDNEFKQSFFILVLTTSVTSFPVVTSLLNDLKIVNSELGRIGQSAALISDIIIMILINGIYVVKLQVEDEAALGFLGMMLVLVFVTIFIIRPSTNWIVKNTPKNGRVKDVYIYAIICLFLVSTSLNRWSPIFMMAPYIIGLGIPTGLPLGSVIVEKFDGLTSGLFMPLFVATCAMRMDIADINTLNASQIVGNSIVIFLTLLAKFGASFFILAYARFPVRDGCALALIMCTKGFVEMANISFLNDNNIFSSNLLCLMLSAVVIVGSITPVLVKSLFDPSRRYTTYEKRTLMHLAPNSNLQILTPIHLPNHVSAVTNLLEASCGSGEKPIGVHVLHLIKLSGQAAPVFISHDKQKPDFSENNSYSENVILSFTKFEANNRESVSVNIFTAISTPNLMFEDVCTLALDSSASIIILPFHRRWYIDGSIESDDNSLRVLNQMVLDRAPCSVGILVDHGYKRRLTSMEYSEEPTKQNVAMIFLGGNDDREALVLAMRMAEDHNINLTVARLIFDNDVNIASWSSVLDTEALRDTKSSRNIFYVEHVANDGPTTASIIRSMMKDFDLFIVGRAANLECQQTTGLEDWVEYPELGVIGDMFVASDVEEKFSVLVVQHQHFTTS